MKMIYDKYELVNSMLGPGVRTLLDVGCRDGVLRKHLKGRIAYTGIDIIEGEAVSKVCNVEKGLPFEDKSFDAVIALDLLEHTDNIWFVFDDLVRVARSQILVVFPNMYHWRHRLSYLAGNEMGKYRLAGKPILDRHRWLTSYCSSKEFCQQMAAVHHLSLNEYPLAGGRRTVVLDSMIGAFSLNLGAWATLFDFHKKTEQ